MTPFIPAEELSTLLRGSFQETSILVAEAIRSEKRFGNSPVHLVATHPKHVVLMSEQGEAFRVGYEISENGTVHFTKQESLPVTVVTEANLRQYAHREAKAAVDLFLGGLTERANEKIAALLPHVDAAVALSDDELVASFRESREQARVWKQLIAEKGEGIKQYLGESAPTAPELKPKFKKLYDGSTSKAEFPTFKGLVHEDVQHLLSRLDAVQQQAESALHAIRSVKESVVATESAEAVMSLESYAADLLDDVNTVRQFVSESVAELGQVDLLAKVFDSIASEVSAFEVAGAFAAKMATRLADAGQ